MRVLRRAELQVRPTRGEGRREGERATTPRLPPPRHVIGRLRRRRLRRRSSAWRSSASGGASARRPLRPPRKAPGPPRPGVSRYPRRLQRRPTGPPSRARPRPSPPCPMRAWLRRCWGSAVAAPLSSGPTTGARGTAARPTKRGARAPAAPRGRRLRTRRTPGPCCCAMTMISGHRPSGCLRLRVRLCGLGGGRCAVCTRARRPLPPSLQARALWSS